MSSVETVWSSLRCVVVRNAPYFMVRGTENHQRLLGERSGATALRSTQSLTHWRFEVSIRPTKRYVWHDMTPVFPDARLSTPEPRTPGRVINTEPRRGFP